MVDREARRQYAQLLRQFISGRMTNDEYEKRFDSIQASVGDPAVWEAYHQIWITYDDYYTHRMTRAHRLTGEDRRSVARMVLFLHSDREYGWPVGQSWGCLLAFLLAADFWAAVSAVDRWPGFAMLAVSAGGLVAVPLLVCAIVLHLCTKRRREAAGDTDVWPFLRQAELDKAMRQPRLLNGVNWEKGQI